MYINVHLLKQKLKTYFVVMNFCVKKVQDKYTSMQKQEHFKIYDHLHNQSLQHKNK